MANNSAKQDDFQHRQQQQQQQQQQQRHHCPGHNDLEEEDKKEESLATSSESSTTAQPAAAAAAAAQPPPMENSNHNQQMNCDWSRFSDWIHCICIVTFDLELGQAMEVIYPPQFSPSEQEKTNICYLAFPDSNSGCMGDTQFHIRLRLAPDAGSSSSSGGSTPCLYQLRENHRKFNLQCIPVQKVDVSHFWGFVYFRQKKDRTLPRGYFQKSFIIITRLPFINLFHEILSQMAPKYFRDGLKALETGCKEIATQWPPLVAGETMNLSLFGTVYQTFIPTKVISKKSSDQQSLNENNTTATTINNTNNNNNSSSSSSSNSNSNNNNDESTSSYGRLHQSGMRHLIRPPKVISSVNEIDIFHSLSWVVGNIYSLWELVLTCEPIVVVGTSPADCSHMVQSLCALIAPLEYCAELRPYFTIHDSEFREFTKNNENNSTSGGGGGGGGGDSSNCNVSASTATATTTTTTTSGVGSTNPPFPSIILGVTNPFFVKLLKNWPHMIRIGDNNHLNIIQELTNQQQQQQQQQQQLQQQQATTNEFLLSGNNMVENRRGTRDSEDEMSINPSSISSQSLSSLSQMSSLAISPSSPQLPPPPITTNLNDGIKPGLYTKYKPFLKKDKTIIKKIVLGIKMKRPEHVQSALLRRQMLELTQSFMIPLERYMASLMPLQKDINPFKSTPKPNQFIQDDFLSTLDQSGPQLTSQLKGNWRGLYKKFFKSLNFRGWYETRYHELEETLQDLQLQALSYADLNQWAQGKQEVEIIDMIIKLKQKLNLCSNGVDYSNNQIVTSAAAAAAAATQPVTAATATTHQSTSSNPSQQLSDGETLSNSIEEQQKSQSTTTTTSNSTTIVNPTMRQQLLQQLESMKQSLPYDLQMILYDT